MPAFTRAKNVLRPMENICAAVFASTANRFHGGIGLSDFLVTM